MTTFSRKAYATAAVILGAVAALSLLGIIHLPLPVRAGLFGLSVFLLVRVTTARRAGRVTVRRDS